MARLPAEPSYSSSRRAPSRAPARLPGRPVPLPELRGEIAVVIGERCLGTSVNDALRYVGGYTIANDWSVHDFRHADRGSMLRVKGQDGFCPLGRCSSARTRSTRTT